MDLMNSLSNMSGIAMLCFGFGFLLVIVEMFHPGFGFPGISGTILLIIGVVLTANSLTEAFLLLIIIISILAVALTFVLKSVTKGRLSKILILHETQKKEDGYRGTDDLKYFVGKKGVTSTILRPAGTADFNGVKLDVVSEGEFISKDEEVKVIKVEGRRIVVRKI